MPQAIGKTQKAKHRLQVRVPDAMSLDLDALKKGLELLYFDRRFPPLPSEQQGRNLSRSVDPAIYKRITDIQQITGETQRRVVLAALARAGQAAF